MTQDDFDAVVRQRDRAISDRDADREQFQREIGRACAELQACMKEANGESYELAGRSDALAAVKKLAEAYDAVGSESETRRRQLVAVSLAAKGNAAIDKTDAAWSEQVEAVQNLRSGYEQDHRALEQEHVRLAGCLMAAEGNATGENDAKEGMYGWSPAYAAVKKLRDERDSLVRAAREREFCHMPPMLPLAVIAWIAWFLIEGVLGIGLGLWLTARGVGAWLRGQWNASFWLTHYEGTARVAWRSRQPFLVTVIMIFFGFTLASPFVVTAIIYHDSVCDRFEREAEAIGVPTPEPIREQLIREHVERQRAARRARKWL